MLYHYLFNQESTMNRPNKKIICTLPRAAGVLMHISSLPGNTGCGTLGKSAYEFIDFLVDSGQQFWQILPINPVVQHYAYSPYATISTFAGNPYFIDYELAKRMHPRCAGTEQLADIGERCDFAHVENELMPLLAQMCSRFLHGDDEQLAMYRQFCAENAYWLDDYCLYKALSRHFDTFNWLEWDEDIAFRNGDALASYSENFRDETEFYHFQQYLFFEQFHALKEYAHHKGIHFVGDIPIYVSYESADAWAHPHLFLIDDQFRPDPVAGVPPDYFSATGQRWGNPLYRWFDDSDKKTLYKPVVEWWSARIAYLKNFYDIIRVDHFRAFSSYWGIPREEKTAVVGEWYEGPSKAFFDELQKRLGSLPLLAEDLGIITDEVRELRDALGIPGMKVLQFAFDMTADNEFLPHNIANPDCVLYTGTHDNNTTNGWYYGTELSEQLRLYVKEYMNLNHDHEFHKYFIRLAYAATARLVMIPAQDILGYGAEFRFNTPGTMNEHNWSWRLGDLSLLRRESEFLRHLVKMYNRRAARDTEKTPKVTTTVFDEELL